MTRPLPLLAMVMLSACGPQGTAGESDANAFDAVAASANDWDVVNIEAAAAQKELDVRSEFDEQEFSAPFPGKYGTTNGMWAFGKITDRMRGETITEAYVVSKSLGDDELLIRLERKNGVTFRAKLEPRRPFYFVICGDACSILISVDGQMHEMVARNANAGATELEVLDPERFERLLKRAQKLFVELPLDDGDRQYEFRTEGLDWSAAEGAEPMFSN